MEQGVDFVKQLKGIFSFVLYDKSKKEIIAGRDHMGIIPLYHGWEASGQYYVASELKALEGICRNIEVFEPGTLYHSTHGFQKWYQPEWSSYESVSQNTSDINQLRDGLEQAVYRQLMSDVPYGVLLSGGLDSSITAALAQKYSARRIESGGNEKAWWPQLHSFAIGLHGSPDLAASRKVADAIGTVHHEIHFTVEEGINSLRDVIYHLETYDVTTVRASTPMYLLARVIKSMGIKMVLSGEGADEIFGGYLYFHKAPNTQAFHEENVRKLSKLCQYDCLRANKSLAAWVVEGRVPFLDKEFMDIAMKLNPADKMVTKDQPIEKYILRKAFEGLIPDEILWRQKEQFSDGVGYSWIDSLKELAEKEVSDQAMAMARFRFPIQPPMSKEEFYYRSIFEELFPSEAAARTVPSVPSVACSSPVALEWDESFKRTSDPSGRAVKVHQQSL
jgi:asparagine synthase (glutamine-hydrolysing)